MTWDEAVRRKHHFALAEMRSAYHGKITAGHAGLSGVAEDFKQRMIDAAREAESLRLANPSLRLPAVLVDLLIEGLGPDSAIRPAKSRRKGNS